MDFGDHDIVVDDAGLLFPVCVSGGALKALWSMGTRPLDAETLIASHREWLEEIAIRKRRAGLSGCCGRVIIASTDLGDLRPPKC